MEVPLTLFISLFPGSRPQGRSRDDGVSGPSGPPRPPPNHSGDIDQRQDVQLGGLRAALPEEVLREGAGAFVHTAVWKVSCICF